MEQLPLSPEPERPKEEKENRPPASHTPSLPRKLHPRQMRRAQKKHPLPVADENSPGIYFRPRWMKRTPQKHPLPVAETANKNTPGTDLLPPPLPSQPAAWPTPWNTDTRNQLYKQAQGSRVKQFSKRPRRDYFFGSPLSLHSKQPHREYFSETSPRACKGPVTELLLQPQTRRGYASVSSTQADPQGGAISLPQSDCHSVFHHPRHSHAQLVLISY